MIRIEDVSVAYDRRVAVSVDDLSVMPGQWLGLVGPNGAGKSSLINAIAGMVAHSGSIRVADRSQADRRAWARLVAWVPQRPVIPPGMSVLDYVLLGRYPHIAYWGVESPDDVAIALAQLRAVDLDGFAERQADQLSGGEQQRMTVARALAQESSVLLLDEPTASLDLGHQITVLALVDELRRTRDLAVVAAMHDLTLAGRFADELMLLVEGEVKAVGYPDEILQPDRLSSAYGTRVTVLQDERGRSVVLPE